MEVPDDAREERYIEVQRRLDPINTQGATLISLLIMVATWGRWHDFAIVVCSQLVVVPFNVWVTRRLLARVGAQRGETLRAAVNLTATVVLCHMAHWPLPVWLWLPFVALAFDHVHGRILWSVLVSMIAVVDVVALLDRVPWIYPTTFTLFSVFCARMSAVRFGVIREMLARSESRGADLARANEELRAAHAELQEEVAARLKLEEAARRMAHQAGRAEMAAGVIHNIKNALNPLSVISGILKLTACSGKAAQLKEAVRCLQDWNNAHASVLANDPKGHRVLVSLDRLAGDWSEETRALLARSDDLGGAVSHIVAVVATQQEHAKPSAMSEVCTPSGLVHEAVALASTSRDGRQVDIAERCDCDTPLALDRHRILQIVTNLIRNAEDSVAATERRDKRIEVSTSFADDRLRVAVSDNGVGLGSGAMARLFQYGFTTKASGHGFGLHSSRLLADEVGGTLLCTSEGEGRGATFTLEVPVARAAPEALSEPP